MNADSAPTDVAVDRLIVSSRLRWLADDFRLGAGPVPVVADLGLDVPTVPDGTNAWWTPAGHAARLVRAGVHLDFAAPGPAWLDSVPAAALQRTVRTVRLDELAGRAQEVRGGFIKVAEAKVPELPAGWWDGAAEFVTAARAAGVPPSSFVQISDRLLDINVEYRCFVAYGTVVAVSAYRDADGSTWEPEWADRHDFDTADACRFAGGVAGGVAGPDGYVIDVASLVDGTWAVIEANPAWCSGTYGADMSGVFEAVVAASATTTPPCMVDLACGSRHGRWAWQPDPFLVADAARLPLLQPWPRPRR